MCSPHPTPARGDPPGHSLVSPPLRRQSSLDSRQLQSLGSPGELGSPHVPSRPSPPCTGTLGGQRYQLLGPQGPGPELALTFISIPTQLSYHGLGTVPGAGDGEAG